MIRVMQKKDYEQARSLWNEIEGMGLRKLDDSCEGIEKFLDRNPTACFTDLTYRNKSVNRRNESS